MTVDQLGRAYRAYRRSAGSRSIVLLLAANAIPLAGVLFFGWSLITILVIYWLENGIVGLWNIPKLLLARGSIVPTIPELPASAGRAATGGDVAAAEDLQASWQRARDAQLRAAAGIEGPLGVNPLLGRVRVLGAPIDGSAGRVALAIFFVMHYGIFWFVHGVFVFALPTFLGGAGPLAGCSGPDSFGTLPGCTGPFGEVLWSNVLIAAVALFLSHGASFLFNYIGRGEYLTTSPMRQMGAVYGRVIVLHLTIIFGAFAVAFLGSPAGALLILVVLKTFLDLGLHRRERLAADARIPADTTFGQVVRGG